MTQNNQPGGLQNAFQYFLEVLGLPPYYAIFYVSSIFVLLNIVPGRFFGETFLVFVYSIVGIFWRHIHEDLRKLFNPSGVLTTRANKVITIVYQLGNAVLVVVLLYWLSQQAFPQLLKLPQFF